jgi:hypothetical protein
MIRIKKNKLLNWEYGHNQPKFIVGDFIYDRSEHDGCIDIRVFEILHVGQTHTYRLRNVSWRRICSQSSTHFSFAGETSTLEFKYQNNFTRV